MKNKKWKGVLVVSVFLIWGLIIYKIMDYRGGGQAVLTTVERPPDLVIQSQRPRETLSLSYPDPFGIQKPKVAAWDEGHPHHPVQNYLPWPHLEYHGKVIAKKNDKQISIISIDAKQYFFLPGQQYDQIKLIEAWRDSAKVSYQDSLIRVIYK